jgi:pseudouridine-5'-phosphate glycosidase
VSRPLVDEEVASALAAGRPVVALETSIVAHGLPPPANLEAALRCEGAVRAQGAVPATVAVLDGRLHVGLSRDQLERLAESPSRALKLSSRDLGAAVAGGADGATTVAGTLRVAALVGIRFMATGGIGGVHRGRGEDESADLFELSRSEVAVFCSGAKMILDLAATVERLETLAVPVIGLGCDQFPAFYSSHSDLPVSTRVDTPEQVADVLSASWSLGCRGMVVAIPPPEELLGAAGIVEQAIAETEGFSGQDVTPALLARVAELSGGRSVDVNLRLVVNNASVAGASAAAWCALPEKPAG